MYFEVSVHHPYGYSRTLVKVDNSPYSLKGWDEFQTAVDKSVGVASVILNFWELENNLA